jgi:hypothetical protein
MKILSRISYSMAGLPLLTAALFAGEPQVSGRLPARDGETCVVCQTRVTRFDSAYLVDGQRVAVMRGMEEDFLAKPGVYIETYRPEGMMFSARLAKTLGSLYFWLGLTALLAVVAVALRYHGAIHPPAGLWKVPLTNSPVACGACGAGNHPSARSCSQCGGRLSPIISSEAEAQRGEA